jgi:hypothetical protein
MALSWHYHGIIMALSWHYHGIIMALSWHYHGIIMGLSWDYHGGLKSPDKFDSYRAIAGASQLLKLFEYVILIVWG